MMLLTEWLIIGILASVIVICVIEFCKLVVMLIDSCELRRPPVVPLSGFYRGLPSFLSEEEEVEVATVEIPVGRHGRAGAHAKRGSSVETSL
jgi:hypothetical protein